MQTTGLNPYTVPALQKAVAEVLKRGGTVSDQAGYALGSTRIGMIFEDSTGRRHNVELRPENWKKGGQVVAQKLASPAPGRMAA